MKQKLLKWKQSITEYCLKDKRIFAEGFCFTKLIFIFVIGSVIGVYYEQLLTLFNHYMADGSVVWESRRGVIYGPLNPLYGAGFVLMAVLLVRKKLPWYQTLIVGSLAGGAFEYVASYLQEIVIGTTSWDYTGYFLEIGGRTTIPFMLAWGIGGLLFTYVAYPFISRLVERIPYNLGIIITRAMIIFLIIDMLLSWTALFRQTMRREGHPPYTIIGEIYDHVYTDEYLDHYYPNMRPKEK